MQKKLLFVLFSIFFVWIFQGCNQSPIPPPERLPYFNSIQIEPDVKNQGKYVTIVGSYIQFLVNPVDSDRIDTGFSFLWESECGGIFLDTLNDTIPQNSVVKINVARWYPDTTVNPGKIHVTLYDSRDSSKDTLINVGVLPYRFEGEIVDSSLQLPTGFGVSSDKIAILDAKNKIVNLYSKTGLNLAGSVVLPDSVENPVDVVFDDYDRMYISSANALIRFTRNGDSYVYDSLIDNLDVKNGRYFHYKNGKLYLTSNYNINLFSIYDTSFNKIQDVKLEVTGAGAVRGGITVDNGNNIYVLYTGRYGTPYLRRYDQNGNLFMDNLLPLDSLPDSTYFYSLFYLSYNLYVCGNSPGWDGVQLASRSEQKLGWKWGSGGSNGPDRFSAIWDATAKGDTFYLLDVGNKALKIFTYIH